MESTKFKINDLVWFNDHVSPTPRPGIIIDPATDTSFYKLPGEEIQVFVECFGFYGGPTGDSNNWFYEKDVEKHSEKLLRKYEKSEDIFLQTAIDELRDHLIERKKAEKKEKKCSTKVANSHKRNIEPKGITKKSKGVSKISGGSGAKPKRTATKSIDATRKPKGETSKPKSEIGKLKIKTVKPKSAAKKQNVKSEIQNRKTKSAAKKQNAKSKIQNLKTKRQNRKSKQQNNDAKAK